MLEDVALRIKKSFQRGFSRPFSIFVRNIQYLIENIFLLKLLVGVSKRNKLFEVSQPLSGKADGDIT